MHNAHSPLLCTLQRSYFYWTADTHSSVPAWPVLRYVQFRVNILQIPVKTLALQPLPQQEALCDVPIGFLSRKTQRGRQSCFQNRNGKKRLCSLLSKHAKQTGRRVKVNIYIFHYTGQSQPFNLSRKHPKNCLLRCVWRGVGGGGGSTLCKACSIKAAHHFLDGRSAAAATPRFYCAHTLSARASLSTLKLD